MREVSIYNNPVATPGFCIKCKSQEKDWFVDLGFDIEASEITKENPVTLWLDGTAYLCCDCVNSLVEDVHRKFAEFVETHDVEVGFNGVGSIAGYDKSSIKNGGQFDGHDSQPESTNGENATILSLTFG